MRPLDTRLLTPAQIADSVSLSVKAVYRAIERGDLIASKLCGRLRVREDDVEAWIEACRVEPINVARTPPRALTPAANGLCALLREKS
jgi:excisionase family DNA binding protein